MNERIKKLAEQAGCGIDGMGYGEGNIEGLAELIVQECVKVCHSRHHTWRWDNEADSESGPRDCARSIQEHFGVK